MRYSPGELVLARRLKRAGIVNPLFTIRAAREAGLQLALACAMLEQETGGGKMIFGHDPTPSIPRAWMGGTVTEARYRAYKARRGPTGRGGMQGVGATQLTWYASQDAADRAGGCWKPYPNLLTGFRLLAGSVRAHGLVAGVALYNGTGSAAQQYANHVIYTLMPKWHRVIIG